MFVRDTFLRTLLIAGLATAACASANSTSNTHRTTAESEIQYYAGTSSRIVGGQVLAVNAALTKRQDFMDVGLSIAELHGWDELSADSQSVVMHNEITRWDEVGEPAPQIRTRGVETGGAYRIQGTFDLKPGPDGYSFTSTKVAPDGNRLSIEAHMSTDASRYVALSTLTRADGTVLCKYEDVLRLIDKPAFQKRLGQLPAKR